MAGISISFVHKLRDAYLSQEGLVGREAIEKDATASILLRAAKLVQAGETDKALALAKENGFDLEALKQAQLESSGKLKSPWPQIVRILTFQRLAKGRELTPEQLETFNQYCMPRRRDDESTEEPAS
jgi:hypothetical protein